MGKAVKKSSEEALNQALDKLVMVCPNKKTYDELKFDVSVVLWK